MPGKQGFASMDRKLVSLIGAKGGAAGTGHKFAHGRISPSQAGKIGGKLSRRGKAAPKEVFFIADASIDNHIIEPFNKQPWYRGWIKRSK